MILTTGLGPDEREYQRCFDRLECLWKLLEADATGGLQFVGSFGWRWRYPEQGAMKAIEEAEIHGRPDASGARTSRICRMFEKSAETPPLGRSNYSKPAKHGS